MKFFAYPSLAAALFTACAPPAPATNAALPVLCPPGTQLVVQSDSDVGWGEVEQVSGCAKPDGTLDGPVVELVAAGRGQATKLVGRYASGIRVGKWRQYVARSSVELGSFTLDDTGSGTEIVRDAVGHYRRGAVVRGRREGLWTYHEADGTLVATSEWSRGHLVRQAARPAWDPPMIDAKDACPVSASTATDDGCPATSP